MDRKNRPLFTCQSVAGIKNVNGNADKLRASCILPCFIHNYRLLPEEFLQNIFSVLRNAEDRSADMDIFERIKREIMADPMNETYTKNGI